MLYGFVVYNNKNVLIVSLFLLLLGDLLHRISQNFKRWWRGGRETRYWRLRKRSRRPTWKDQTLKSSSWRDERHLNRQASFYTKTQPLWICPEMIDHLLSPFSWNWSIRRSKRNRKTPQSLSKWKAIWEEPNRKWMGRSVPLRNSCHGN